MPRHPNAGFWLFLAAFSLLAATLTSFKFQICNFSLPKKLLFCNPAHWPVPIYFNFIYLALSRSDFIFVFFGQWRYNKALEDILKNIRNNITIK